MLFVRISVNKTKMCTNVFSNHVHIHFFIFIFYKKICVVNYYVCEWLYKCLLFLHINMCMSVQYVCVFESVLCGVVRNGYGS